MSRVRSFAVVLALAAASPGLADTFTAPRIVRATVDWPAAAADAARLVPSGHSDQDILTRINAAAGSAYPGIAGSAVPVFVPLQSDGRPLANRRDENAATAPSADAEPEPAFSVSYFAAGPSGYDAAFVPGAATTRELGLTPKDHAVVVMTGTSVLYELDGVLPSGLPVKELDAQFPGITRTWLESHLRYSFVRYGVTYTASVVCHEGRARGRRLSCRVADRLLSQFVGSLRLAGGTPQTADAERVQTIARPEAESPDFTYHAPGRLIANTGMRGHGGAPDATVYARIRFPLAEGPAYANSQSFMHWGDCDQMGGIPRPVTKGTTYRCKVNGKLLVFDESAAENRAYPWRDNFCEHRWFFVGQCPSGSGHQGQDIRPATCKLRNPGADRCEPHHDAIVAVRDGTIMRAPGGASIHLVVNAPGEHLRFRYLHLHPKLLDADSVLSGRTVREGDVLGKAGNYDKRENGTTYHLHFDVQVPTRHGWVFVSPYMTLVTAYERLIGGRGRMIEDDIAARTDAVDAEPAPETAEATATVRALPASTLALPRAISAPPTEPKRIDGKPRERRSEGKRTGSSCEAKLSDRARKRGCKSHTGERDRAGRARRV
jgi:murein DD-endopeptidase MepM/ murein hydrolase activator NlpD